MVLHPPVPANWAPLFAIACDPAIWAGHPAHDRWQLPVFRRFFDASLTSGAVLVAVATVTVAIVGRSR